MTRLQSIGAASAFLNAIMGLLMFGVAIVFIGPTALSDQNVLIELARNNPLPLYIQDGLKFLAAAIALALIWALYQHLATKSPALLKVAAGFGILSVALLVANACFSLYATSQAASFSPSQGQTGLQLSLLVSVLGLASIFANGPFYIFGSWAALKTAQLPKYLNYLGLLTGVLSLLPPLAIFVLLFSIIWSVWLGFVFLRIRSI